jgi:hypothetical protein
MKTIKLHIKSADISEERIKELEAAPLNKKPVTKEELAVHAGNAFAVLIIGVGMIIVAIVLTLVGLAEVGFFSVILLVLLIAGIVFVIKSFVDLFKSFRKLRYKTPEQAISTFFETVLMTDFDKKQVKYSYNSLMRMMPEINSIEFKEYNKYLTDFRYTVVRYVNNAYKEVLGKTTTPDIIPAISYDYSPPETTATETHMSKTRVNVTFLESLVEPYVGYINFDITLELLLIKSGKYWFVADPLPEFTFET